MVRVANPACFIGVAVAVGSAQAQSARQLLPTGALSGALTVATGRRSMACRLLISTIKE